VVDFSEAQYRERVDAELLFFKDRVDVHDLPPIFHYWSNGKIRPKFEAFGFSSPQGMFEKFLQEACRLAPESPKRFLSIGSGNCDREIGLAQLLISKGHANFVIDCLEINPNMLERARIDALQKGVSAQICGLEADFNNWEPAYEYDAVVACQALHHVVNLEGLFRQIRSALKHNGVFIIADMIGRNGHLRWLEALEIVHEFWRELPQAYRFNRLLNRHEELYENWDCSTGGFEGIRSQDILPLLLKYFYFQLFLAYGNIIDPFVDRAFGHNFDVSSEWDRDFIDRVHERDQQEMLTERIKPVHMEAVVRKTPCVTMQYHRPLTPSFCVRWPEEIENPATRMLCAATEEVEAVTAQLRSLEHDKIALQNRVDFLETKLGRAADSRWIKLGRKVGVGPKLP
jgi:SAM-dependent methyltransferase